MSFSNDLRDWLNRVSVRLARGARWLASFYHPATLREKGWIWTAAVALVTLLVAIGALGWYWSAEPAPFNVRQVALERAGGDQSKLVTGYVYTSTLMKIGETLLDKRGGYLSNDILPPGAWMDNMPNWEFGALVMLRDGTQALRNNFARSQSQSLEDPDLARAEPQFNFQNDSWILPSTESEYRQGLKDLDRYLLRLADTGQPGAQFYARADNLRAYLEVVEKRLGSLSQRLSASVGQVRVNTDLAGDGAARQATPSPATVSTRTPWGQLDDVFYEARGSTWALLHILQAVEIDFNGVLRKKNALVSLQQIIRELQATQQPLLSPVILNGSGFGLFANYSLTMANYVSRANAALIDLGDLLQQG
ncbi:MAG: DUF2333 family protein [Gammaproteobacteria bacterium]